LEREPKIQPSQPGRIVSLPPNLPAWFDTNQAVDGDRCLIFHPSRKHWSDFHEKDFIGNWYAGNEAGEASRAWPDWFAPATRIWVENYSYGAVYSPDGVLVQFDNGTIWHRDLGLPPPPPSRYHK
jgi:hypothetical protein